MSIQWTIVASFLYAEMAICVLLMLPFISPSRWRKVFKSRLFNALTAYGNIYFTIFTAVLVILFIDGIRDVYRYSKPLGLEERNNPTAEINLHMKLFRSQRNFYIAGFALFLSLVLRRLITLISSHGALQAEFEAVSKQAKSASDAAMRFMENKENEQNKAKEEEEESKTKDELQKSRDEIQALKEEISRRKADLEAMKHQAESTNREYDRLLDEHSKLQVKIKEIDGNASSKKDE